MEKLIKIVNQFEETLKKEIKIKALTDIEEAMKPLESSINSIKEKFAELRNLDKMQDLVSSFENNFNSLGETIANKFAKLFNAMRSLESESSPKSILVPKLDKIFEEIARDKIFDISIYNEIVNDLKVRMEIDLVNKIERELFGVRESFKEKKRIPEILNEYRNEIQKSILEFKQMYHDNFKSDKFMVGFDDRFLATVNNSFINLSQEVDKLITEFTTALAAYQEIPMQLLTNLALGTINYNEGDYFGASKFFSFAANIFDFLNQDISEIAKNLGISFLNLSNEYLRAVKVLIFEKDFERIIDLILKGLNYFFLANLHLGNQMKENFNNLSSAYLKILETVKDMKMEEEDQELAKRVNFILREHYNQVNKESDAKLIKIISKQNYEKIKDFQPLKIYYCMVIYKTNGLVIFSKTSTMLHEMPEMDENLIAGMISAISGFLGEVLKGDENLSLIDRDNIKIILEYSTNLIGLIFLNKESPQIRDDLKTILSKTEEKYQIDFKDWTGEVTKFSEVNDFVSKVMK